MYPICSQMGKICHMLKYCQLSCRLLTITASYWKPMLPEKKKKNGNILIDLSISLKTRFLV